MTTTVKKLITNFRWARSMFLWYKKHSHFGKHSLISRKKS